MRDLLFRMPGKSDKHSPVVNLTVHDSISLVDTRRHGRTLVWLHQCNLFFPASIRMWVRSSTNGIRRDEVSMSRFSFSHLHSCNNSSLIRSSCLRVSSSIIMEWNSRKAAHV